MDNLAQDQKGLQCSSKNAWIVQEWLIYRKTNLEDFAITSLKDASLLG